MLLSSKYDMTTEARVGSFTFLKVLANYIALHPW
jgi:hypothetical protein